MKLTGAAILVSRDMKSCRRPRQLILIVRPQVSNLFRTACVEVGRAFRLSRSVDRGRCWGRRQVNYLFGLEGGMEKTRSEYVFEQFCQENALRLDRVERDNDSKTPDYEVFTEENRVVIEIKELQANDDEAAAWDEARTNGAAAAFADPRNRIRQKIGAAVKQLKRRSEGLHPAVLVLFDNGTFGGIDATDIKNAMYGDETVVVKRSVAGDVCIAPRLGGGRKCTATDNRSLSAVALLWTAGGVASLSIFHNVFARCPLPPSWFTGARCRQYSIDLDCDSGLPQWHAV
jgi:hypothetical protein